METPLPNDSSKASLSPPVGSRLRSFKRNWLINKCSQNVLNIITNGYVLPFRSKPNLIRFPLILSEYKAQQKDQALATCIQSLLSKNAIERVENVKSLGFYSRLFLVPKPHQRWRPVIDLSRLNTFLHVEKFKNGNSRVHQDFPGSRGVGIVPHPSKLKEISRVLLQGPGVPVHLPTFRTGHSPPGLYDDRKGSETNGPLKRTQNSPIPGRLADQVPVSGGIPSGHTGSGRPNPILGLDNQPRKIRTETYSGVFVRGLRIPPRFSPCKTHSREMAQTSGFDPTTQVKTCFDCKMFDVSNWVASLNGENGPGGTPSHEALSVSSQGALEISSVAGQPPSLDRSHCSPPRLVAKPLKRDERLRPSSQGPQYPTLYRRLKRRLGCSLRSKVYKRSVVRSGKKATHKCPGIEGGLSLALRDFKDQCQNQTVLVATDNSTVVAYINKQGGTHSAEMCALLWKIMTWCHHYHITLKARHIPGCLNVMADLLSRSNQVQSTEWSLHPQVFKQICQKWFTPHVDLFATHLNHKLPLYVSPIPDLRAWDIDALNIDWTNLMAYAYPPTALLHKVIQKIKQCHCLIIVIAPGWPGMPWFWDLVQLSTEIPLQLPVSTTLLKQSHKYVFPQQPTTAEPPRLMSRSGQLQEQGFSVEVAERIAAPQRSSTRTIYKSKWALFEKWCRENSVDFSTPSVKQISDFFMYLYQDQTGAPRPLMVTGLQSLTLWAQRPNILDTMQTFIGYSPVFTGIVPKVPETYPSGTFLLSSTSSQKHHLSP